MAWWRSSMLEVDLSCELVELIPASTVWYIDCVPQQNTSCTCSLLIGAWLAFVSSPDRFGLGQKCLFSMPLFFNEFSWVLLICTVENDPSFAGRFVHFWKAEFFLHRWLNGSHSMGVGGGVHGAYYGVDQSSYRIQSKVASEAWRQHRETFGIVHWSPLEDRVISKK